MAKTVEELLVTAHAIVRRVDPQARCGCGEPATKVIEYFSEEVVGVPLRGIYTCDDHANPAIYLAAK